MKLGRVGLAALFTLVTPIALASAQSDGDESDPAPGDLDPDGTVTHESDEVIGPDDGPGASPDDGPADDGPKAKPVAGYDKGFFIRTADDKFTLRISARVQPQFIFSRVKTPGTDYLGRFQLRRARLVLEGNLHGKDLLYKFQADFGRGNVALRDFHADVRLSGDTWLRFGQWKRPFSRQQITSSGRLELVERSITDKAFGAGRDLGIALRNDYEKSTPIEWTLGVWNGTGEEASFAGGTPTNVPVEFKPVFVGRVGINSDGNKGYSEADLEGGPLRWGAAASAAIETDFDADDTSSDKVELDFNVKAQGFSTTGGVYAMTAQTDVQTLRSQELALVGFHLQAGYMFTPEIQAAARYAHLNQRIENPVNQHEVTIGGNYYGWGHDAKLAADVRLLKTGDGKLADDITFELAANIGF